MRGTWSLANATNAAASSYLSGLYGKWHSGSLSNRSGSNDCYEVDGASNCLEGYMRFGADHRGSQASCCQGVDALSWPGNPHFTNRALGISHPLHFGFTEFVATPQCGAYVLTIPIAMFTSSRSHTRWTHCKVLILQILHHELWVLLLPHASQLILLQLGALLRAPTAEGLPEQLVHRVLAVLRG